MAPTPLIPDGVYKLRNGQFTKLVADLIGGNPYGFIVGAINRPSNKYDQWRITNHGNGGNEVTIENVSTGTFAFATEDQNTSLQGSDIVAFWTIVKVDGGKFAIQSADGNFVWVLPDAYKSILLVHQTGQDNTKWFFDFVHP